MRWSGKEVLEAHRAHPREQEGRQRTGVQEVGRYSAGPSCKVGILITVGFFARTVSFSQRRRKPHHKLRVRMVEEAWMLEEMGKRMKQPPRSVGEARWGKT